MILVTGGAGFIGSHVVERLVAAGESVRVFDLPSTKIDHLPKDRIELVAGDIRDRACVQAAVRDCEHVYHLAANPNLWTRYRSDFDAVNHQGTVNVLEEALSAGATRIVHVSTESILVQRTAEGSRRMEDVVLNSEDMVGPYCLSKYEAEKCALDLAKGGAPIIVVNPTLPIGPGDWKVSPPTRLTLDFCRGRLPAYLDCRFNMIDVRDVAGGIIAAHQKGVPGRRYLLGGKNLRLIEWLGIIGRIIGRRPPRIRFPYSLALAYAYLAEFIADHVTHKTPAASVTGVKLTRYSMHFDPTASLTELDVHPRPIEESAQDAIRWYRKIGWL